MLEDRYSYRLLETEVASVEGNGRKIKAREAGEKRKGWGIQEKRGGVRKGKAEKGKGSEGDGKGEAG